MDNHLQTVQASLSQHNLDALLVSSLPNIIYLTGFSGFTREDRDAFLLITKSDQYIFTHGIYKEAVEKEMKNFTLISMSRGQPISASLKELIKTQRINQLGFEAFDLTVQEYDRLIKDINALIIRPTNLINQLRIYKTPEEIAAIKQACLLGDRAFAYILKKITPDDTEKSIAAKLEYFIKSSGADISFRTIVAAGSNASHPHHVTTNKIIEKNNCLLLDFGVKLNNYCSDMTRTVFLGKASPKQKKVYQTVLVAQQKAIEQYNNLAQSEIKAAELDKVARDYILSLGYPSIPHSLGHGIGLEVHEMPSLSPTAQDTLKSGMVFSIEPGIYLPSDMGVRIEDLFAIENNKLVQLTNSPKELIEI